jgi:PAS domain S-box-containing protein
MPAAVVIVEASSGKIIFSNRAARQGTELILSQPVPQELEQYRDLHDSSNFKMFHADGRPYEVEEWPLTRSIRSGEEVRDEEIIHLLGDGTQLWACYDSYPIYDKEGRIVAGVLVSRDITEQKRAEQEFRESHNRVESILESITDAFFAVDREARYTYINERALLTLQRVKGKGLTREDVLGKSAWELSPELVGSVFYHKHHEALREQKTVHYEAYAPWSERWYEVHIYPSEEGLSVYNRDITERKEAEEQLAYHAYLLENVHDAVIATDEQLLVTAWNKGAQEMYGWRADEVLGRNLWEVVPSDLSEEQRAHALRELSERGRFRTEAMTYGKDGTPVYTEGITIALRGEQEEEGQITGYVSIRRDITERKRAEQEIETRTHQQAVVSEIGLWALTNDDLQSLMDDTVAFVAQTLDVEYCKIVELLPSGEELLLKAGAGWEEGLVGQTRVGAGIDSQAGYTLLSEEPVIVEHLSTETRFSPSELLREYGVVSSMTVVIAGRGGPFGVLGVHTKDRRAFSEDDVNFLQAVANVLAMRIEREEADNKLEEVREAERSRIARDLHDEALQNLSNALVEAEQVRSISEGPEPASRLERLIATLKRIGQQLRGAIYDLRLEVEQDRPFSELLESLVELHRGMAPGSNIHLELAAWVLERPLGTTSREVLRIVGEALTNARRHSEAENVWVRVWSSEGKLYAEVSDDGRGFDVSEEPSATPTFRGGIGIRGMNERAHLLGGELKIESEPGNGTKVLFELALEQEQEEAKEEKVRVLLVEDHATVRDAIASSFEGEAGFEVVGQAASLAQARTMLEETGQRVDVAMVDLGLPDGYGADLIGELREKNPQAQVLVLSATADRSEIARVAEAGAAGILNKTVHLDEVVETVRRLRAGETIMPLEEVVELLRYAGRERRQEYEARQVIEKLTPREREVLQALAEGLDSEGVAQKLNISLRTERNHMSSVLAKLGVHSQLQALVFAVRHGVVEIH